MTTKPLILTFIADPGHGWLAVPVQLYAEIGSPALSRFSYRSDVMIYAEEDCDAQVIIDCFHRDGIAFEIREAVVKADAFVRLLPRMMAAQLAKVG
jgi:hypothetical protein